MSNRFTALYAVLYRFDRIKHNISGSALGRTIKQQMEQQMGDALSFGAT